MATVQVKIPESLTKKLDRIGDEKARRKALSIAAGKVQRMIRKYPPPPPNSTYIRTNRLHDGWKTETKKDHARVFNGVSYAPFVQGEAMQAQIHQGRWVTDGGFASENEAMIKEFFERAYLQYINK